VNRTTYRWLAIFAAGGLLAGCDMGGDSKPNANKGRTKLVSPGMEPLEPLESPSEQPESPPGPGKSGSGDSQQKQPPASEPLKPSAAAKPASPPPVGPGEVRIRAEAGVGKRGRYDGEGLLVTPVKVYWQTRQWLELEAKLRKTLDIYANMPGKGLPKTAEAFMEMCEENNISLPELRPGETYVWDPAEGELYLVRPR